MAHYLTHNKILQEYIWNTKKGYIVGYYLLDHYVRDLTNKPRNPIKTKLKNAQNIAINDRYAQTELDLSRDTFKEALENKKYIENECWLYTLYDFYKDTLLSPTKQI